MVNTFVVHSDLSRSAELLDSVRLNKQAVEARQIISILEQLEALHPKPPPKFGTWEAKKKWRDEALAKSQKKIGWARHPAVLMWIGFTLGLKYYFNCCLKEWQARGKNNYIMKIYELPDEVIELPFWVGMEKIHKIHRASLVLKEIQRNEPIWYLGQKIFKEAPPFVDYIWEP